MHNNTKKILFHAPYGKTTWNYKLKILLCCKYKNNLSYTPLNLVICHLSLARRLKMDIMRIVLIYNF
jgi:hypothetical protein